MEHVKRKDTRFITVAAYQRMTGLSYQTVMHMIRTRQVKYIETEGGHYKIDTLADINKDAVELIHILNDTQKFVMALCKQFNTSLN